MTECPVCDGYSLHQEERIEAAGQAHREALRVIRLREDAKLPWPRPRSHEDSAYYDAYIAHADSPHV